jgi:hypothetical protein
LVHVDATALAPYTKAPKFPSSRASSSTYLKKAISRNGKMIPKISISKSSRHFNSDLTDRNLERDLPESE